MVDRAKTDPQTEYLLDGEGASKFYPGVTLQISVGRIFDDPVFDIACDVACDIFRPFFGRMSGQMFSEHNIHTAAHGVTGDMTHHRIAFEDKLSPGAYISLRVRSRSDKPVKVVSVESSYLPPTN